MANVLNDPSSSSWHFCVRAARLWPALYCLRKTAATEIEKTNPLVTEMLLAHTEKGQKRHYAERTCTMLDAALGEMEKVIGLTLPAGYGG
jgi:hypothetical protein